MKSQIDLNDVKYVEERFGLTIEALPCPIDEKTGKINPQVSRFRVLGGKPGEYISLFHVKPIYYETVGFAWRPMYEVCSHYGNRLVIFKHEDLPKIHPRFIDWLNKRMKLINGKILVTSPFSENYFEFNSFLQSLQRAISKPTVGLTTTTVYPDPNPESVTVDGYTDHATAASGVSWATLIAAAGTAASDSAVNWFITNIWASTTSNQWRELIRGAALFDTSSIPDTDEISAAVLSVYGFDKDTTGLSPNCGVRSVNPASNTALVSGDYATYGSTAFCDSPITGAAFSTSGYNDMTLNAAGIAAISKTGVSKFGVTNDAWDRAAVAPTWSSGVNPHLRCYGADEAGTTKDPKLVVTHAAASALTVSVNDTLTITESVTMLLTSFINKSDSISITESLSMALALTMSVSDAITITESVTINNTQLGGISVNDALSITENVTVTNTTLGGISVSDSIGISESLTVTRTVFAYVGPANMRSDQQDWPLAMDDDTIL